MRRDAQRLGRGRGSGTRAPAASLAVRLRRWLRLTAPVHQVNHRPTHYRRGAR